MSSTGLTFDSKIAIEKATTWLTPASLGAGSRIPVISANFDATPDIIEDDTIVDTAERAEHDLGPSRLSPGDIQSAFDYAQHKIHLILALIMGQAGVPTEVEAAARYKHVLKWVPNVQGLFATLGKELALGTSKALQVASAKPSVVKLSGNAGGRIEQIATFLGAGFLRDVDPSSWAFDADPNRGGSVHGLLQQGVFRINAVSGGALASGDVVYPRDFTLSLDRGHAEEATRENLIEEPQPDGFASVKFDMGFFRATEALVDLLRDSRDNKTPLKADYVFTGPTLGAGNYTLTKYLPRLVVTPDSAALDLPSAGRVPFAVSFNAHEAPSLPTGFPTGYVEALCMELVNGTNADILA